MKKIEMDRIWDMQMLKQQLEQYEQQKSKRQKGLAEILFMFTNEVFWKYEGENYADFIDGVWSTLWAIMNIERERN